MTIDNVEMVAVPDRSINVLLSLGTYQGMSDSEIESLITWHKTNALIEATNAAELNAHSATMNEIVEANRHNAQALESMVQSVVSRQVAMGVIADDQA